MHSWLTEIPSIVHVLPCLCNVWYAIPRNYFWRVTLIELFVALCCNRLCFLRNSRRDAKELILIAWIDGGLCLAHTHTEYIIVVILAFNAAPLHCELTLVFSRLFTEWDWLWIANRIMLKREWPFEWLSYLVVQTYSYTVTKIEPNEDSFYFPQLG